MQDNLRRKIPRHILTKLIKIKDKENISKATRETMVLSWKMAEE